MQVVVKDYCEETSFLVRFGRSKISLDIPDNGKVTEEGWRITPSTHPTVSAYAISSVVLMLALVIYFQFN